MQVLQIASEDRLSRFGTVNLDGIKIHANASRNSVLYYALRKQTVGRAGVRHCHIGGGIRILAARPSESSERMDASLPRVEFETHGRITSAIGKTVRNRAPVTKNQPNSGKYPLFALHQ